MPLKAAIRQLLRPLVAIGHTCAGFYEFFHPQLVQKRLQVDAKAPVFNRVITYQLKEKGLIKVSI